MISTRTETDSFGPIEVPADTYWGAQTERSITNFPFGAREQMPVEIVHALGFVKQAAARVNARLGKLEPQLAEAIQQAAAEVARGDLDDTIRRLQAFEAVGADVLYSPGVHDIDTIRKVVSSVGKPFNLVMGFADPTLTVDQLSKAGVKRISVGGAMERYALAAFLRSAREMKDHGAFTYVREMAPIGEIRKAFAAAQK